MSITRLIEEFTKEAAMDVIRRTASEYCLVHVQTGVYPNGSKKWYWMLEDQEVFCRIGRDFKTKEIQEYFPCQLTQTSIHVGRGMDASDCIMI